VEGIKTMNENTKLAIKSIACGIACAIIFKHLGFSFLEILMLAAAVSVWSGL